jgi:hypothetical protein
MHKDRTIGGKSYRVMVDPPNAKNPVSRVAVFVEKDGKLEKIDGSEALALPTQTDQDLLKQGWEFAEEHQRKTG